MKRSILFLTLLLLVQVSLALGLYLDDQGMASSDTDEKLLGFTTAQVEGLEFSGPGSKPLVLQKTAEGWILPEHFSAPADADKITQLLATLEGMNRPWPVAKTADAGKRFKVDEQDFERKLVFRGKDGDLATLLLGSSPGFRKVHSRLSGEDQIYDIPFSTYQASCKSQDWIDHTVLQIKPEEINAISFNDFKLARQDGSLKLDQLADNQQTNTDQAQKLLGDFARLTIQDIDAKADQPLPGPIDLQVQLTLQDGSTRDYIFTKGDVKDNKTADDLLKVTGSPFLYKVNSGLVEELKGFNREQLVQTKTAAEPADQNAGTPATQHPQRG
jgi:Domain of unknown function (DUF4340)